MVFFIKEIKSEKNGEKEKKFSSVQRQKEKKKKGRR